MSERSCPVSGSVGGVCPAGMHHNRSSSHTGPRGCSFSGFTQPGDITEAFDIPRGVDVEQWLRMRERKSLTDVLYSDLPTPEVVDAAKSQAEIDAFNAPEHDLLAVALGAPARQVMLRAQEIGPRTGWRDGYLSVEHGCCPPDYDESPTALARSPGRIWSDLCERMPGCVASGRARASIAALPVVEGSAEVIPDAALMAASVALGILCSIFRFEGKHNGRNGVSLADEKEENTSGMPAYETGDHLGAELVGLPLAVALPFYQVSRRMGKPVPYLSFPDQSSYNIRVRDAKSTYPFVARFDNIDLRWPIFGQRAEVAFLKGCAVTSASFQHGPDAIAACQEHVMHRNIEGLLQEMVRLKEILERMPGAFHTINPNPNSGENYVSATHWTQWALFSAPLSRRCPASSGLQFPPFLIMDAFLGRTGYDSFLGKEGVHLRAWLPASHRAFIAAIEYHYRVPEFVRQSGDPRLIGVLDGIVEAYTGERGFMGVHRYKVFGILEVAGKTGRTETNGASGAADASRPWDETHRQFSEAMKERLEPYRGRLAVEPHQMRGSFEECRYVSRVLRRAAVDADQARSIALVTLDLHDTGITFAPGDRLAIMPLNPWAEVAKVAAALGLDDDAGGRLLHGPVDVSRDATWLRFERHLGDVRRLGRRSVDGTAKLTVVDILRRGHLAPITQELALRVHERLQASSRTVLQVLASEAWPVSGTLGDLLQAAVQDTPSHVWDTAFDLADVASWLPELVTVEVPRTYSIASYTDEMLPDSVDLAVSRAESKLSAVFGEEEELRAGVSSGFLNPRPRMGQTTVDYGNDYSDDGGDDDDDDDSGGDDEHNEILIGVSRPVAFQLPIDPMAPCAFFAGGSGIAPFRSFWQARLVQSGLNGGTNALYLGVQSRERFCFEDELREYVAAGFLEVHTAFSRDERGLVCEDGSLVERRMPARRIDALIVERGRSVADLVMSKRQGGLGGYVFVCGSVAVFDSVMQGIRRAIYNHRTATMDSVDMVVNKAFAERRIMLDVFMTPTPLPCNTPTIPLSQLARHTGHRPGSRMWIAVHGRVYDVTDFAPMHPGGTMIIQSNAGVDCSQTFDDLAHTNNPEVSSLLTKYFVGHLAGKPRLVGPPGDDTMAELYDLWAAYLRSSVETLVAHQFEMYEILGARRDAGSDHDPAGNSNIWIREGLQNTMAVRVFYGYQSRMLQGGFAKLFGPALQQLVLKLSFCLASVQSELGGDATAATGSDAATTKLPDVLGTVARAKTSEAAETCTREVARVGQFITDPDAPLRFQERGVFAYAARSVELDMALLEGLREEACAGMDAFDTVAAAAASAAGDDGDGAEDASDEHRRDLHAAKAAALSSFLLQVLERMARRLELFYAQLAQCSVYHPELERNPARTRWQLVRQRIRDGSLFVLASQADVQTMSSSSSPAYSLYGPHYYMGRHNPNRAIEFDQVMAQVRGSLQAAHDVLDRSADSSSARAAAPLSLNDIHHSRPVVPGDLNAAGAVGDGDLRTLRAMGRFLEKNNKAIRRLSRMPTAAALEDALQRGIFDDVSPGSNPFPGTHPFSPPLSGSSAFPMPASMAGHPVAKQHHSGSVHHHHHHHRLPPSPPTSQPSSRASSVGPPPLGRPTVESLLRRINSRPTSNHSMPPMPARTSTPMPSSMSGRPLHRRTTSSNSSHYGGGGISQGLQHGGHNNNNNNNNMAAYPVIRQGSTSSHQHQALAAAMQQLHVAAAAASSRGSTAAPTAPLHTRASRAQSVGSAHLHNGSVSVRSSSIARGRQRPGGEGPGGFSTGHTSSHVRVGSMSNLRALKLQSVLMAEKLPQRVAPTF